MKQKYKKLTFLTLLLSMLTGCMFLSGCMENTGNASQSYIVDSDKLQNTETQMELVEGPLKAQEQEKASETEQQDQTEQNQYSIEKNDTEKGKSAGNLEVHFIDVGQGDATLIKCDGHYMLIDAGNNDKGTLVQNYLQHQGVETLDYVIGTHPDADHIGGMDVILYKFDCKTIIMPDVANNTRTYDDVVQTMKNKGYKTTYPVVGETYTIGGAAFTIIAPNKEYGNDMNSWSVGVLLQNGNHRFLFTGDAEEGAEQDILQNGIDISADVYKVAHHGSNTATSQAFLDAVHPTYAVISAGESNSYGHPHAEVLNRLRAAGVSVFRTDEQGTIVATSDGTTLTWNMSPSESWQAGEAKKSQDTDKSEKSTDSQNNAETDDSGTGAETAAETAAQSAAYAVENESVSDSSTDTADSNISDGTADSDINAGSDANAANAAVSNPTDQTDGNSDVIVHITKTGEKYHSAGCQYLRKSDIEVTLSEAKVRGLTPCSKCNPPQ